MKIINAVLAAALIIALTAGGYTAYGKMKKEKQTAPDVPVTEVMQEDLELKIAGLGVISARKSTPIYTPIAGKIIRLCPEGTEVKKGDFLFEMDTTSLIKQERDNKLTWEQSTADVSSAEESLRILRISARLEIENKESQLEYDKTELQTAQSNLQRQKRLFEEQIVTLQDVESEEAKVRAKQAAVAKDLIDVEIARRKSNSDILQKEAEIQVLKTKTKKNRLDYEIATQDLSRATVTAPEAGLVIYTSFWKNGAYGQVAEGDDMHKRRNIMELPDMSSLIMTLPVSETEIHRIRKNQKVRMTLDSVPGKIFYGTVEKIPAVTSEIDSFSISSVPGQKSFMVLIAVDSAEGNLIRPGMTAAADVLEKEFNNVLTIPQECIFTENDQKFVWKKTDSGFSRTPVKTGEQNEDRIVVLSGLEKGNLVALRNPEAAPEVPAAVSATDAGPSLPGKSASRP